VLARQQLPLPSRISSNSDYTDPVKTARTGTNNAPWMLCERKADLCAITESPKIGYAQIPWNIALSAIDREGIVAKTVRIFTRRG